MDPGSAKRVYWARCIALPMYRLLRSLGTGAALVAAGFFGVAGAMTGVVDLCVGLAPGISVLGPSRTRFGCFGSLPLSGLALPGVPAKPPPPSQRSVTSFHGVVRPIGLTRSSAMA